MVILKKDPIEAKYAQILAKNYFFQVSSLLHLPDDVRIPVPLSGHRGHMLLGPDVVEDVALALPVDRTLAEHAPNLVHLNR